jgi:Zn-finger nucleic acid-binding protein
MQQITYAHITVERCLGCKGIWFDLQEQKKLMAVKGSEVIDNGSPSVGEVHNQQGDFDCPKCLHKMSKMVDHQQPHIWYEQCPGCGGVYLDAGEFTDLKDTGVLDKLKDWFAKPRMQ